MYTQGKISKSDYRMWFHLNNKTKISILTPFGETDGATIMNGIGHYTYIHDSKLQAKVVSQQH